MNKAFLAIWVVEGYGDNDARCFYSKKHRCNPKYKVGEASFPCCWCFSFREKGKSEIDAPSLEEYYPKPLPDGKRSPKPTNKFPFWLPRPRFDTVDWEDFSPSPRQQGRKKGTCWAIVAVETAMALHPIKTGEILNLSVRYLVDHTVARGCLLWVDNWSNMAKYGLPLETDYPYRRSFPLSESISSQRSRIR